MRSCPAAALVLALLALTACSGATRPAAAPAAAAVPSAAERARYPYTAADVHFMTAMIEHHAQAVTMARMAPTHGASPAIQTLAARILNAQRDEIATMQQWLRDRGQAVPEPDSDDMAAMHHHGGDAAMADMPGMLTPQQLAQLDAARGQEFDRLFLTFMIQHHRGAVSMVDELFRTPGAAQDDLAFKIAADVGVDQKTEIARMQRMLATLLFDTPAP